MVVGAGGVPVGAERQVREEKPSRREVTRGLLASVAALGLAPVVAASRPLPPAGDAQDRAFDETYRGHRIQGFLVPAAARRVGAGEWQISVDGRPLHLMRRADGTWMSMVDHYTSYATPLEAARAAADEIGPGERLREMAPGPVGAEHPGHGMGGMHGVRA
ncbi:tyrosinase family oxidase copper chaperone [Streptomyces sp. NPDC001781]